MADLAAGNPYGGGRFAGAAAVHAGHRGRYRRVPNRAGHGPHRRPQPDRLTADRPAVPLGGRTHSCVTDATARNSVTSARSTTASRLTRASARSGSFVAQRPLPAFVAPGLAVPLRGAAARWSVSAARAAGLRGESGFDPDARSPSAALGIAQFMPGTVRVYGRDDAFDSDGAT